MPSLNASSRGRRLLTASALSAAAVLALSSCSTSSSSGDGDALQVVATTTQLTDFTAQIGGDDIELTGLLTAGGSAHHFDPTPADLLALGDADVLVVNGAGLETFIDSAVEASGFDGEIIDASQGIDLVEAEEITAEGEAEVETGAAAHDHEHGDDHEHADDAEAHDHEHEEAHDHAAEDEHAEESHEHEDEHAEESHDHEDGHDHDHDHDHDHGPVNPHLWTAPAYAADMVAEIAAGLSAADPEHAEGYEERAAAYIEQLDALDSWTAEQFERVPAEQRVLVTGHDSLRYYLHDYGIGFAGAILPSFEDNAEPSAAQIDELVQRIKDRGVQAVFVESSMSPKLAETIAREAGVTVVEESALYADALGEPGGGADTYIDATVQNTRTILEAWGAEVDDPPAAVGAQ